MDKFCLIAIMLFAIQRNMVNCPIVDVINEIDRERDILPRHVNCTKICSLLTKGYLIAKRSNISVAHITVCEDSGMFIL